MFVNEESPNSHFYCEENPALDAREIMVLVASVNVDEC